MEQNFNDALNDALGNVLKKMEERIKEAKEVEEMKVKMREQGADDGTFCMLGCCSSLIHSSVDVLQTLCHMMEHHHMISAGEVALELLHELWLAMDFVAGVEQKYGVELHINDVNPLKMDEIIKHVEEELQKVRDAREKADRTEDYVEGACGAEGEDD